MHGNGNFDHTENHRNYIACCFGADSVPSAAGAFCTNTYSKIQAHNQSNPNAPMTLAPSFGFLSQFRSQNGHAYPGNTSDNELGLVLYSDWADFCKSYIRSAMASYLNDANVLGFFSDNEKKNAYWLSLPTMR